ncbi:MAG: metallophosphoesterase [Gemmataceae bacterium]
MASLETRLQTIRRAIAGFRSTPGRKGSRVDLHHAEDILISGDLHGHVENFRQIMQRADLGRHPRRHLLVQELIHGPFAYPGGGDKSHQLIDLICALQCQYPGRIHYLMGNHELAQWMDRPILKSEDDLNAHFRRGVDMGYGERAGEVYDLYRQVFAALPFAVRTEGRLLLSHSLPSSGMMERFDPAALSCDPLRPEDLEPRGSLYSLVWGRDTQPANVEAYLAKMDADLLISGHIALDEGFVQASQRHWILDCKGSPAAACLLPADRPVMPEQVRENMVTW